MFFIRTIELSILIYPHAVSIPRYELWVCQVALEVKNSPAKQGTWIQSLVREDPLEEGMITHSCILTWRIPWTEGPGRLQSIGLQRVGHDRSDLAQMHA